MGNNRNVAWGGGGGDGSSSIVGSGPQGLPTIDVGYYGAAGDGVTNDTVAVQAAIDAAFAAGGGYVSFRDGTFRCNIVMKPRVKLFGQGIGSTVLKAVAGSNADVVKGLNFATLTGKIKATGDYALGAYEAELRDLTVDGDKATQTAGYGIRLWGRGLRMENVTVSNCKQDGIWTEFTDVDSFADATQILEGYFHNIIVHGCDGNGWTFRGPHDSVLVNGTTYSNALWGFRNEATAGGYTGGITVFTLNSFLNANGWFSNTGIVAYGGQASQSNTGTCVELASTTGSCKLDSTILAGGTIGLLLRGTNHYCDVQCINNPGDAVKVDGPGWCDVRITGINNNNGFNVVSESGPNKFRAIMQILAAGAAPFNVNQTLKSGAAWLGQTSLDLFANGSSPSSPASVVQLSGTGITAGGWTPVLPASNGTLIPGGVQTLTYSASITPDINASGVLYRIVITNGTAFTINNPTNPTAWPITFDIKNSSGGAHGVITWGAGFLNGGAGTVGTGAFAGIANGKRRTISFYWDGTNWVEVGTRSADI